MIAFVRGGFIVKNPNQVIVDVNGVGYALQISLQTYAAIANKENGLLHTYLHITENAHVLYGFADIAERDLFLQLISVSGVGAATARQILSGMKGEEIVQAIVQSNIQLLSTVKGIGKKTAERIIVELKDKLQKHQTGFEGIQSAISTADTDAINALMALGIGKQMAEQAVRKTIASNQQLSLEEIIKQALKNL
ncbi:MAG: Holliday junction branch migration protein RuvA [Sphingobacteriia bacterium]|nr:Holliday junction branch migration protein RuvA [Sphingobacteriia bacterium]